MPDISPVSRAELAERRRRLRHQRRWRAVQTSWRAVAVSGLTVGLIWATTLPAWVIHRSNQVEIQGNELLSAQAIQALLPIAYPQSLLAIQPGAIARHLESQGPIASALVTRRLFPPGLVIEIQERYPVAIAYTSPTNIEVAAQSGSSARSGIGLLDEKGNWIPLESFTALNQSLQLPELKVLGNPEQYRTQWAELYQAISRSPIKISQVDWREPANLILTTELGTVHFGAYSPRFRQQMQALDQMRQISEQINPQEIAYIDLKNPEAPMLQTIQATGAITFDSP
jgi:cell division protein FtsQ